MKQFKTLVALVLVAMMIVGTMSMALAEDEPTKKIHISGLEAGDTVFSYKVIKMNTTTGKYEWNITGMTDDELTEIVGHYDATTKQYVDGSISEATAAKIANIVKDLVSTGTEATGATLDIDGVVGEGNYATEAGLYCALIAAADVNTVYNPVFAAIQYEQTGAKEDDNSTLNASNATYTNTKVKKSTIDVKKVAVSGDKGTDGNGGDDKLTTNNVGDIVTFTVTTKIPAFGVNFTSAVYNISDSMSNGLEFQDFTSITVGGNAVDKTSGKAGETTYIKTITKDADKHGWTLEFDPAYLITNNTVQDVTIIYTAKVTNEAAKNVNPDTNEVEVEFSHNPKDFNDKKKIKDETRHYTFSIDVGLLGNDEYTTSEFVKIGVDNDGNPITEEKTMDNQTVTHPLAGAKFKLYKADGTTPYTNDTITAETVFTTNSDGKLEIKGLDAGSYKLVETEAPTDYIPDTTPIDVVITAEYETISVDPDATAGSGDEYSYQALKSYTITIGGTTSTYTMTNDGAKKDAEVTQGDTTKEWQNRKGVTLPSTGGIGTTIFYVAGIVLVLGAAAILVARRKAEQ